MKGPETWQIDPKAPMNDKFQKYLFAMIFPILSTVFLERLGGLIEELELETIVEAISELEIPRSLDCCCSGVTKDK